MSSWVAAADAWQDNEAAGISSGKPMNDSVSIDEVLACTHELVVVVQLPVVHVDSLTDGKVKLHSLLAEDGGDMVP